jgi:Na+/H+-dicarboxylate symporter
LTVFINVAISVIEMMEIGRAGSIGWKTIGLYLATTVIASVFGILSIVSFKGLIKAESFEDPLPPTVRLGCNAADMFLTEMDDGSVVCSADMDASSEFFIEDLTSTFVKSTEKLRSDISLSETVYEGIFTKLFTDNIILSFSDANFAAVIFFAIAFGVALGKVILGSERRTSESIIMVFLKELEAVFLTLVNWIIACTP